jgi:hypothetical protein
METRILDLDAEIEDDDTWQWGWDSSDGLQDTVTNVCYPTEVVLTVYSGIAPGKKRTTMT